MKLSKFMFVFLLSFSTSVYANIGSEASAIVQLKKISKSKKISEEQKIVLNQAHEIANKDGLSKTNPLLLSGIVLQESGAGENAVYKKSNAGIFTPHKYYGLCQIKLAAAKEVLKRFPLMRAEFDITFISDSDLIKKLRFDNDFNMSIASKYLLILRSMGFKSNNELALAYNQGPGGAKRFNPDTHVYPTSVLNHISTIKSHF